jgi:hypothetical protein
VIESGLGVFGEDCVGYIQNVEGILMNKICGLGVGGGSRLVQYQVNGS